MSDNPVAKRIRDICRTYGVQNLGGDVFDVLLDAGKEIKWLEDLVTDLENRVGVRQRKQRPPKPTPPPPPPKK